VVFSRDEHRRRLPGIPPRPVVRESRRVLMPRDADRGGTWIAVNEGGVVLALLNVNSSPLCASGLVPGSFESRGVVVDRLAGSTSAAGAIERIGMLVDQRRFRPFRLLAFDRQGIWSEAVWTGERMYRTRGRLTGPAMRTSSGLGDEAVVGPRRTLFRELVGSAPSSFAAAQDAFHRHQWPGREHLSVLMSRADARTVSITTVEVDARGVRMFYETPSRGAERSLS